MARNYARCVITQSIYCDIKNTNILLSKNTCHKKLLPPTGFLISFFPTKKIIYYESYMIKYKKES